MCGTDIPLTAMLILFAFDEIERFTPLKSTAYRSVKFLRCFEQAAGGKNKAFKFVIFYTWNRRCNGGKKFAGYCRLLELEVERAVSNVPWERNLI